MSEHSSRVQSAIDRFNSGDSRGLDDLFARAIGRMEQIARRMLRGFGRVSALEQTGDIVQEASVRLLKALRGLRDDPEKRVNKPLEFFRLVAYHIRFVLLDLTHHHYGPEGPAANRDNVQLGGGDSKSPGYDPAADTYDPVVLAAWAEFHRRVESLPTKQRDVFDLLWYEELTQEEAAEMLGVPVITVRRRWRDAKLTMIEFLGDRLPDELA